MSRNIPNRNQDSPDTQKDRKQIQKETSGLTPKVRAVFFDLDGTLTDPETGKVPSSTQKALKQLQKNGILVFLATGRPRMWADLLKEKLDFEFDGRVLLNGQFCVDQNNRVIHSNPLTEEQLENILHWSADHPEIRCVFMESDNAFSNLSDGRGMEVLSPQEAQKRTVYQVAPKVGPEMDDEILSQVSGIRSARWNSSSTDLIPENGGKTAGIEAMLSHYGIDRDETIAFGDGDNDSEMLAYVHAGIAMGNGSENAKEAADFIAAPVNRDGIAMALKKFGLI